MGQVARYGTTEVNESPGAGAAAVGVIPIPCRDAVEENENRPFTGASTKIKVETEAVKRVCQIHFLRPHIDRDFIVLSCREDGIGVVFNFPIDIAGLFVDIGFNPEEACIAVLPDGNVDFVRAAVGLVNIHGKLAQVAGRGIKHGIAAVGC